MPISHTHLRKLLFPVTCSYVESTDNLRLISDDKYFKFLPLGLDGKALRANASVRFIIGGVERFSCSSVLLEHIIALTKVYII